MAVAVDLAGEPDHGRVGAPVTVAAGEEALDERGPDLEALEVGGRVPQQRDGRQVRAAVRARVDPVAQGYPAQQGRPLGTEEHEKRHQGEAVLGDEALPVQNGRSFGVDGLAGGQQGRREPVVAAGVPRLGAVGGGPGGGRGVRVVRRERGAVLGDAAVRLALGLQMDAAAGICQDHGVYGVPQLRRKVLEPERLLLLLLGLCHSLAFLEMMLGKVGKLALEAISSPFAVCQIRHHRPHPLAPLARH